MREIGSEFDLSPDILSLAPTFDLCRFLGLDRDHFVLVQGGRTALRYYLRYLAGEASGEFLLPAYLCQAILDPFKLAGVRFGFYRLKENLEVDLADLAARITTGTRGILVIHYFGFPQPREVMAFLEEKKNQGIDVIEDLTQAFFSAAGSMGRTGNYALASFRKFIPIPDGGILYTRGTLPRVDLPSGYDDYFTRRLIGQVWKHKYLQRGEIGPKAFLRCFREGEAAYESCREIRAMTGFSQLVLARIDVQTIIRARRRNFLALLQELSGVTGIRPFYAELPQDVCPLGFPLLAGEERNGLREHLIENNIFPPVHWLLPGEVDPRVYTGEYRLSRQILTIPCDQRYRTRDMAAVAAAVKGYFRRRRFY